MTRAKLQQRFAAYLSPKWLNRPRVRNTVLLTAIAFLIGGIIYSVNKHPEALEIPKPWALLYLVLLGVPVTIALNTTEMVLMARLLKLSLPFPRALSATIIATAANTLPIPGGTIARVLELSAIGAAYKHGIGVNVFSALAWFSVSFLYGALWTFLVTDLVWMGLLLLGLGAAFLPLSWICLVKWARIPTRVAVFYGLRLVLIVVDSLRIYWCLQAIGVDADFGKASILVITGAFASAVSLVPAGLGVRELIGAAFAPLIGLPPALIFLAIAINRIVGLMVNIPGAAILVAVNSKNLRKDAKPIGHDLQ